MKIPYQDIVINGQVIKSKYSYLKNERLDIHTSLRKDIHNDISKISKRHKKSISKILDCIYLTFEAHPEIKREFFKRLKDY